MENDNKKTVLKKAVVWQELHFYRKSDTVYQLTAENAALKQALEEAKRRLGFL